LVSIWNRPEHMIPTGTMSLNEISKNLNSQKNQCLNYLDEMPNGEGVLYRTTMTVNQLGKIDVYQYIYFLAMHITRHLMQMEKIEREFYEN
jgi:DNA-binding Lrp family transcriptional regulator